MGFEWSVEAGTAEKRDAFRELMGAGSFWRGGWQPADVVFGSGNGGFRGVRTHSKYACQSMRSKHQAGPVVTRYQRSNLAVVLPAGSAWRSIAQPLAFALGSWDTAKRRAPERWVVQRCPPEVAASRSLQTGSRSRRRRLVIQPKWRIRAESLSAGRVVRIGARTLRGSASGCGTCCGGRNPSSER